MPRTTRGFPDSSLRSAMEECPRHACTSLNNEKCTLNAEGEKDHAHCLPCKSLERMFGFIVAQACEVVVNVSQQRDFKNPACQCLQEAACKTQRTTTMRWRSCGTPVYAYRFDPNDGRWKLRRKVRRDVQRCRWRLCICTLFAHTSLQLVITVFSEKRNRCLL